MRRWFVFDIEVFPEWFCIVIKEKGLGKYGVITSDSFPDSRPMYQLIDLMANRENTFTGYNIKGYDLLALNYIIDNVKKHTPVKDLCTGLFSLSNDIISGNARNGYPYGLCTFSDLKDDVSDWLSLKEYESNKGLEIKESSVPFGKRNLTKEDKQEIIKYCCKDVDATEQMLGDRWNYVNTKIRLAQRFGLDPNNSLKRTDPSLVCDILVRNRDFDKSFLSEPIAYTLPPSVAGYIKANVPLWLVDEFLDYEHFDSAPKEFQLFGNIVTIGEGGLHSVNTKGTGADQILYIENKPGFVYLTIDVQSYYPHLICVFDYQARATTDKSLYPSILQTRMMWKPKLKEHPELKQDSDDFKLILNSAGGAYQQQFLSLYDPKNYIGRVFTGQLLLIALCKELYDNCKARIIQTNTDGIVMVVPDTLENEVMLRIRSWEALTKMSFDVEKFSRMWQRDVNNYVLIKENGKAKNCGSWLDYEIDPFHNICFPIIQKAIYNYLVHGIDLTKTVMSETNPMMFLYTVKRGGTFDKTILSVKGTEREVNKVNRIFAAKRNSPNSGMLYKGKGTRRFRVPDCPDFACIYNEAVTTMPETLDRLWYLNEANNALLRLERIDF